MILFEKDWDKYPNATVNHLTKNTSFINYAAILKALGVKNYLWPLSTLNPALVGVDPHSPEINLAQMGWIKFECEQNPWYYLRECLIVPAPSGIGGDPFRANRANMSMIWSFLNHVDYMLIQPRQTGKTITISGLISWLLYIKLWNTRIGLVTKSDDLRRDTAEKVRQMQGGLPGYLTINDRRDSITDALVTYKTRKNRFVLSVSRGDPAGAIKVGRGNTVPVNLWDEFPFIPHVKIAYGAAMPGTDAAYANARQKGLPYGSLITTTAGSQDSRDGQFAYSILSKAAKWSDTMFDCDDENDYRETVKAHCRGRKIIVNGTWSHSQMGVPDAVHYSNIANSTQEGDDAARDYFNIWTVGGESHPLDKATLRKIKESQIDPQYDEKFGKFIINWFYPEHIVETFVNKVMLVGNDTSEGGGNDGLTLYFIDPEDGGVLGSCSLNETLLPHYGEFVANVLIKYERSLYIPERKSTGQTFIDTVCIALHAEGIDPFRRIFNNIVQESDSDVDAFTKIRGDVRSRDDAFYIKRKTKFGFSTGVKTRKELYDSVFQFMAKKAGTRCRCVTLINQIMGLESKNGRVDHSSKGNDDSVIAWLLCGWVLLYGVHLEYYGIKVSTIFSKAAEDREVSSEEIMRRIAIEELNDRMEDLLERLKTTDIPILVTRYEKELSLIEQELAELGMESVNIRSKIDDINKERYKRVEKYYR
ncbi:hypothetical protein [Serratia phage PCH45]|uniref:hypothetical protein n=1 Tax=Serratia phage PCH45 TaxID=2608368 RepID=UPI0012AA2A7B|nr:hypothetical protein [Serratia phage PCH45]